MRFYELACASPDGRCALHGGARRIFVVFHGILSRGSPVCVSTPPPPTPPPRTMMMGTGRASIATTGIHTRCGWTRSHTSGAVECVSTIGYTHTPTPTPTHIRVVFSPWCALAICVVDVTGHPIDDGKFALCRVYTLRGAVCGAMRPFIVRPD